MGNLESISDSLYLNQSLDVLKKCDSLREKLETNREILKGYLEKKYPPLRDIIENKLRIFTEMGYSNPRGPLSVEILEKLLKLGEYQTNISLFGEAVSTLREWIVSYAIYICGYYLDRWYDYNEVRKNVSEALNVLRDINELGKTDVDGHLSECLKNRGELIRFWTQVRNIRNIFAHAGISVERIGSVKTNKEKILNLYKRAEENLEEVKDA